MSVEEIAARRGVMAEVRLLAGAPDAGRTAMREVLESGGAEKLREQLAAAV